MTDYTREELSEFKKLILMGESRDQRVRIMSRLEMSKFVGKHGNEKCDAMMKKIGASKDVDQFALKKPCKHCPFSPGPEAIRFRSRSRAEEIAESAYRNGFPCHKSSIDVEDYGYVMGPETQHCAGALMMFVSDGHEEGWPGIENDEDRADKIRAHMDWKSPHFECEQDFLDFHDPKKRGKK